MGNFTPNIALSIKLGSKWHEEKVYKQNLYCIIYVPSASISSLGKLVGGGSRTTGSWPGKTEQFAEHG